MTTTDRELSTIEVERDGKDPLRFYGRLLAEASTQFSRPRWTELRIYSRHSRVGRWRLFGFVVEEVGRSTVKDEKDRRSAYITETFLQAHLILGDGSLARQLFRDALEALES